jgi:glycerophosphoryl diester phosphodiesterase
MMAKFHLQGHRGSRGTCPENTLPSFEQALNAQVSSIETDIHLTRDGIPVLCHDPFLSPSIFRRREKIGTAPTRRIPIRDLALNEIREWNATGNPDPVRFPQQQAEATPVALAFAAEHGIDPFAVPALSDFFAFVNAYAGQAGIEAGKTPAQRRHAQNLIFDLEIKYIPFHASRYAEPEDIVEGVLKAIREAGIETRTVIRSFDHRLLNRVADCGAEVTTGLLLAAGTPVDPIRLVRAAGASIFCPLFEYVDADLIRKCHEGGIRVLPWTVNETEDWDRLLAWSTDGITTDYPERLREHLEARQIEWE